MDRISPYRNLPGCTDSEATHVSEYLLCTWWCLSHTLPHLFYITPLRYRSDYAHFKGIERAQQ